MKAVGGRIAFVDGADLVAARMYTDLASIRRGWTKNLYRLRGRRPLAALASLLELGVTLVWPVGCVEAPLTGPAGSGWLAALGLGLVLGAEVPFRAWRGDDPRWSPTAPARRRAGGRFPPGVGRSSRRSSSPPRRGCCDPRPRLVGPGEV